MRRWLGYPEIPCWHDAGSLHRFQEQRVLEQGKAMSLWQGKGKLGAVECLHAVAPACSPLIPAAPLLLNRLIAL
jgi:hypothetical protein